MSCGAKKEAIILSFIEKTESKEITWKRETRVTKTSIEESRKKSVIFATLAGKEYQICRYGHNFSLLVNEFTLVNTEDFGEKFVNDPVHKLHQLAYAQLSNPDRYIPDLLTYDKVLKDLYITEDTPSVDTPSSLEWEERGGGLILQYAGKVLALVTDNFQPLAHCRAGISSPGTKLSLYLPGVEGREANTEYSTVAEAMEVGSQRVKSWFKEMAPVLKELS